MSEDRIQGFFDRFRKSRHVSDFVEHESGVHYIPYESLYSYQKTCVDSDNPIKRMAALQCGWGVDALLDDPDPEVASLAEAYFSDQEIDESMIPDEITEVDLNEES